MQLPFSHEAFLDLFGAYNSALWPAVVALWVATVVLVVGWMRRGRLDGRPVLALLAVHWAWSGIAYHWLFFRSINPAAALFAAAFVLQAALFAWLAARRSGHVAIGRDLRGVLGGALLVYGLAYPFVGLGLGLDYPRLPLFAVPCPTTLVTAGLLLCSYDLPRIASLIPLLWAVVGSSAASALGIRADLGLVVAAVLLGLDMLAPSALGRRQPIPQVHRAQR